MFDSVGFAIKHFAALRNVRNFVGRDEHAMDPGPDIANPEDLFEPSLSDITVQRRVLVVEMGLNRIPPQTKTPGQNPGVLKFL